MKLVFAVFLGLLSLSLAKGPCDKVHKDVRTLMDEYKDAEDKEAALDAVLESADDITEACMDDFARDFKPDTCNMTRVACVLRRKRGSFKFAESLRKCLKPDMVCPFFVHFFNDSRAFQDMSMDSIRQIGKMLDNEDCDVSSLPLTRLMLLPAPLIKRTLAKITDQWAMWDVMAELADNNALMGHFPCDAAKVLMERASEVISLKDLDTIAPKEDRVRLMLEPLYVSAIMPEGMCKDMAANVVQLLKDGEVELDVVLAFVAKQSFECGGRRKPNPVLEKNFKMLECWGDIAEMDWGEEGGMGMDGGMVGGGMDMGDIDMEGEGMKGGDVCSPDWSGEVSMEGVSGIDISGGSTAGGGGGKGGKGGEGGKGRTDSVESGGSSEGMGKDGPKLKCKDVIEGLKGGKSSSAGGGKPGGRSKRMVVEEEDWEEEDEGLSIDLGDLWGTLGVWGTPAKTCAHGFPCGEILLSALVNSSLLQLDGDEVASKIGNLEDCRNTEQVLDSLKPGNCQVKNVGSVRGSPRDLKDALEKCRPRGKGPGKYTESDWEGLGCSAISMGKTDLDESDPKAICDNNKKLRDCAEEGMTKSYRDFISQKCKDLRPSMQGYRPPKQIREMSDEDFMADLPYIVVSVNDRAKKRDNKGWKGTAKAAQDKGDLKLKDLLDMHEWINVYPLILAKEEAGTNSEALIENLQMWSVDVKLPKKVGKHAMKIILLETPPSEVTSDEVALVGSGVNALAPGVLRSLGSYNWLDISKQLCLQSDWTNEQGEAIKDVIVKGLEEFDADKPHDQLTATDVEGMDARCVMHLHSSFVAKLRCEVVKEVIEKISNAENLRCQINKRERRRLANLAVKCYNMDRDNLSEENLDVLGKLLPDLDDEKAAADGDKTIMKKVDKCLLKRALAKLGRVGLRDMSDEQRDVAIERVCNGFRDCNDNDETVASVYELLCSDEEISKEELQARLSEIAEDRNLPRGSDRAAEDACVRKDKGKDEIADEIDEADNKAIEIVQDEMKRRRRRQATSLDCVSMRTIGDSLLGMSLDELQALEAGEVFDCVADIGLVTGWDEDQVDELIAKFEEWLEAAGGDLCGVSEGDLMVMGEVAYGLSTYDIACLEYLSEDAMSVLGALSRWSKEQLEALAARFMENADLLGAGSLTGAHMVSMGHALCGLSPDQIAKLKSDEFMSVMGYIGSLEWCPQEQLEALVDQAAEGYDKEPSSWDYSHFQEAGLFLGGIKGDDLAKISKDDIDGWTPIGIMHIQGHNLKKMSASQLETFDMEQARAVTDEAYAQLSDAQRQSLDKAQVGGDGSDASPDDDGDGGTDSVGSVTFNLLLLALMLAFLQL